VERRRLLDRMPVFLILRDHCPHDILVAIVPAALRDADLSHEGRALKLTKADGATRARFRTLVVGIEAERAINDRLELAESDLSGLGVTVGGSVQNPPFRKFLAPVRPVGDGQYNSKHLTVALLGAREQTILTDAAGLDVDDEGGLGPLWDLRFE